MVQSFDEEDRRLRAQQATLQAQSQAAFKCIACDEDCPEDDIAPISGCSHKFCRDCLRNYVISKLKDKVHPTFCPVCAAATERVEPASGFIDDHLLQTIGLNDEQYEELREIQLSAQCIFLGCQRCNEPMYADRTEHETAMILVCPLQQCNHAWCKACQKTIADFDATAHACAGVLELESLMKDKGWKYCPVCRTPYEKKEGCNHMQCEPPCLAHFCYECGELIVRSAPAYETDEAINAHYRRCVKFDYPHVT
ncbi:hypothetical protein C8R44DRAFT_831784 [Mycena epipterygia]|nr:hypothetical protein C8R44DRAFT_831784 [Mycena epipterygia]